MDKEMPLREYLNLIRGCLATLELKISPNARDVVTNHLNALLTCYTIDDHKARFYADKLETNIKEVYMVVETGPGGLKVSVKDG